MKNYEMVVIGASAGGLNALSAILKELSGEYPVPLVVVQHRSRDARTLLEEVLQDKCRLEVRQADEKEEVRKGTVYIAPPDYHLLLENDRTFSLTADQMMNYSRPSIDVLFESAATVYGNRLVGIILTGANQDGALGITAIRNNGGMTIAQDPQEAEHKTMPQAAINTGDVVKVMPISGIVKFLLEMTSTSLS